MGLMTSDSGIEGGPLVLPEHVQNLPVLGLGVASATSIAALKNAGRVRAGQTATGSLGIALAFLPRISWPGLLRWRPLSLLGWLVAGAVAGRDALAPLAADGCRRLRAATLPGGSNGYFRQASDQIGAAEPNDFIFGDLHRAAREQLFAGVKANQVTDAVPVGVLPEHPVVRYAAAAPTIQELAELLGLPDGTLPLSDAEAKNELKLEAPLAVQGQSGHAGFFPFNKFSTVQLLIKAAREA